MCLICYKKQPHPINRAARNFISERIYSFKLRLTVFFSDLIHFLWKLFEVATVHVCFILKREERMNDPSKMRFVKHQRSFDVNNLRFYTGTPVNWAAGFALITCGTTVLPVITRDGLWVVQATALSCYREQWITTRAIIRTHCHHFTRLVLARNRISSRCLLKKRSND